MSKIAVVFLAVVAAASAGVLVPYYPGSTMGSYRDCGCGLQLQGYPSGMYDQLFGLYTEKYGQNVYETPIELVNQIQYIFTDLSIIFDNSMYFTEQHAQFLSVYARHFAYIIKTIVHQLEAYEHVDVVIQDVIYNLREVYMNFEKLAGYGISTDVHHFRIEFYNYIQLTIAQIEKLVMIAQQESHGGFYYIIKDVLHFFLYGLYDIQYQFKNFVGFEQHYGMGYGYGQGYGYPKYGSGYGYPWYKYSQGYGYPWYKYGQGYRYGMGYGYGKYGVGYGWGGVSQYGKGFGYGYTPYTGYWGSTLYNRVY